MDNEALFLDRIQFGFTIAYHYLFPQLTMGLALLIVILKGTYLRTRDERYNNSARFWTKIFGANFAMGVITGIPMEFQFGTNWAQFSTFAGGVIGHTLAMEGIFSFFLESAFLGILLFGEKRFGHTLHFIAAVLVFVGSWLSGYLIVMTNAWMQFPVGYQFAEDGTVQLAHYWDLLLNPWGIWQYLHTMSGSVVTAGFVVAGVGAYYLLARRDSEYGRIFVRLGVIAALIASVLVILPTGDQQGKNIAHHQPATLAAMEGLFETKDGAELMLIGQPDMEKLRMDNPIYIPKLLSFLTFYRWSAEVKGLDAFPRTDWPDNIPLLYYSYHIMVGLGTFFVAVLLLAALRLRKGALYSSRGTLWLLLLAIPFPYLANTAGWMTAELGRQPWLVYGLLRTAQGMSPTVSAGNNLFTLLGFLGIYFLFGVLFLFIVVRHINHGPEAIARSHIAH